MKNMMIGILIVILVAAFMQPLIEFSNVLKEKVTLGAAITNSCRAARNNALASVNYYDSGNMGDLDAYIEEDEFRYFFAEAFSQTLGVDIIDAKANPIKSRPNEFWNEITIWIDLEYEDTSSHGFDYSGRVMSKAIVEVETPYLFRTGLLRASANASRTQYRIKTEKVFLVQIIN